MICQLQITHLRNLTHANLALGDCNVFVGKNGSGKTSLLEAVFLLSRGKTFRHHEPKHYINHQQDACVVWAKTSTDTLALQKKLNPQSQSEATLKLNGQSVNAQSALAYALPVLLIDPSGMAVLEEGSHARRQMLDWLVFHVKPEFYEVWLSYQRLLRHRNSLLKSAKNQGRLHELSAWNHQLSAHAQRLHECRLAVFERWQIRFDELLGRLLPRYRGDIYLAYQAGFDDEVGLLSVLEARLHSDMELGYTRVGAHRADVVVMLKQSDKPNKGQAVHVLSRGEKKLLITALRLSQLQTMCDFHLKKPVVLIDDIDSELDDEAINVLLEVVLSLPCQLFITSLQDETVQFIKNKIAPVQPPKSCKTFHVKQGEVLVY
ncbi:MAG: DNA replication and repair protein RecF [Moraxella sp.]|uniref:DNA replication/repair protein RecF n=1 Tax=Moraxella sp. TaxID=479 RepID=UPI0026DD8FB7|nr:DNA replication and repair protein RecF [Moraxella sp.]MDO4449539.1 DNA replication and repair protein RecF [Moraxella sp.]